MLFRSLRRPAQGLPRREVAHAAAIAGEHLQQQVAQVLVAGLAVLASAVLALAESLT